MCWYQDTMGGSDNPLGVHQCSTAPGNQSSIDRHCYHLSLINRDDIIIWIWIWNNGIPPVLPCTSILKWMTRHNIHISSLKVSQVHSNWFLVPWQYVAKTLSAVEWLQKQCQCCLGQFQRCWRVFWCDPGMQWWPRGEGTQGDPGCIKFILSQLAEKD